MDNNLNFFSGSQAKVPLPNFNTVFNNRNQKFYLLRLLEVLQTNSDKAILLKSQILQVVYESLGHKYLPSISVALPFFFVTPDCFTASFLYGATQKTPWLFIVQSNFGDLCNTCIKIYEILVAFKQEQDTTSEVISEQQGKIKPFVRLDPEFWQQHQANLMGNIFEAATSQMISIPNMLPAQVSVYIPHQNPQSLGVHMVPNMANHIQVNHPANPMFQIIHHVCPNHLAQIEQHNQQLQIQRINHEVNQAFQVPIQQRNQNGAYEEEEDSNNNLEIPGEALPVVQHSKEKKVYFDDSPRQMEPDQSDQKKQINVPTNDNQQMDMYDVEFIVDKRRVGKRVEYLVKWTGYSLEESTWEPKQNLFCHSMIRKFERRRRLKFRHDV